MAAFLVSITAYSRYNFKEGIMLRLNYSSTLGLQLNAVPKIDGKLKIIQVHYKIAYIGLQSWNSGLRPIF
jgi:hypothetical protein